MSTLVQFLAAGVKGAESGTATFLLRGTASSAAAALYTDFENVAQPGTNIITLDANGAAEIYCDTYCDVTLKNSAGATLRTVTIGNSASLVEVRSTSFTGTDYDGAPANTIGEPITLKDVLDKWITSAGAPDWKVLIAGVATNMSSAFPSFAGMFFNVKDPAYGAVGDGVTDDTTAISAATTAANGGIVFFPPGTYKITSLTLGGANINWLGSGDGVSIISGLTGTNLLALSDNTSTAWKNFTGLSFTSSGAYARLLLVEDTQNASFVRCSFDGSLCSTAIIERSAGAGLSKHLFTDCDFTLGASTPLGLVTGAPTTSSHVTLRGCHFKVPNGFTGTVLRGAGMNAEGCRFDASAVTAGVYRHIDAVDANVAGKYVGVFTGNTFLDGGSTGFVFKLTTLSSACDFSEDGNVFIGFTAPSATLEKGQTYEITDADSGSPGDIRLGSRKGRTVHITSSAATLTASACLEAESVVIEHTGATFAVTVPHLIPGLRGNVAVFSATGAQTINFLGAPAENTSVSFIECTDVTNGALFAVLGTDQACSCDYFTVTRGSGTFKSLITGITKHDIAV